MYTDHFSLIQKPFQTTTDPKFLWLGEKHKHALVSLRYGLMDNPGIMLLTGEVGTGKTLLVNYLKSVLEKDTVIASLVDPNLKTMDFFNLLAYEFKWREGFDSKSKFLLQLCNFLCACHANHQRVLLVVDESQRLNQGLIEEIRLLSNIELNNRKLINVFFVGQQECNDILLRPQNSALTQRISVHCHIESLDENETGLYIDHRLKVAGSNSPIFNREAVEEMYRVSGGLPRLINIVSDQCLLTAYVQGHRQVNDLIVRECAKELRFPDSKPNQETATVRIVTSETDQESSQQMIESPLDALVPITQDGTPHSANQSYKSPTMVWMAYAFVFAILIGGMAYLYSQYNSGYY